jgi:hypothetical protein
MDQQDKVKSNKQIIYTKTLLPPETRGSKPCGNAMQQEVLIIIILLLLLLLFLFLFFLINS